MKQFQSDIIYNRQICADFFEMALAWGADAPVPGQFLTVRVSGDNVPLLRRPFAFAGFDAAAGAALIIYQRRGRGTEILAEKRAGDRVDVIGPLGTPFPIDDGVKAAVAVAGGVGLGPILFLASALKERGISVSFVFGCRSSQFIPNTAEFNNVNAHICTDDGSAGFRGNVVQYIEGKVSLDGESVVYGCGPVPMLKNLYRHAQLSNAKTWVSLESMMACGVGACAGCAVPMASGFLRACKEGPVFDGGDVLWEQMV